MRFARQPSTLQAEEAPDDPSGDAHLVRRAQIAPQDFAPLYLRYRDRVINYCYYRLANDAEAEDAASAVFLKALHALPAFRDRDGSFRTWLFRIAHNEVADRRKHRARHPEAPLDDLIGAISPEQAPEERAIANDGRGRILALLVSLPPRERAVLELRAADLTTSEIARVLGITEQNVRTAQCRAAAHMRELAGASGLSGQEVHRA